MPLPRLHLLAAVATIFPLFAVASVSIASPITDDFPQTAHDAAVLDRVFAHWKARHDRVHSLHFTWDCRTTYRKGWFDPSRSPGTRLDRDQVFDQFGVQLWIDGDERLCLVETPSFKVPQAKVTDTRRVVRRLVIVGKTASLFSVGSEYETGAPPTRALGPHGLVFPSSAVARSLPDPDLQALSLTFRPQRPAVVTWLREQCRLVDENASVDNRHCVKLQRVVEGSGRLYPRREEACWVCPACDDVVVRWTVKSPVATCLGSIKYKKEKVDGWIPSEWSCDNEGRQLNEFKMTSYAINEGIDSGTFSQNFPAGTPVEDNGTGRHYIVEQNGSQRTISHEVYLRRAGVYLPEKQFPAK